MASPPQLSASSQQPLSSRIPPLLPRKKPSLPPPSNPPPSTLPFPPPLTSLDNHLFRKPRRRILSQHDLELFLSSPAYDLLTSFIFTLSDSVRDLPISALDSRKEGHSSPPKLHQTTTAILQILSSAESLVDQYPPLSSTPSNSRFGNAGFRPFFDAFQSSLEHWHRDILGLENSYARNEVSSYLGNAIGNRARVDYGSGHELHFFVWLLCLERLGLFEPDSTNPTTQSSSPPPSKFAPLILIVLPRYIHLMRKLQSTYYLEPAGSQGVWGLDDYQFLPFLFGASQLVHHPYLRPRSIHSALLLEEHAHDYLYFDMVAFVGSVKKGSALGSTYGGSVVSELRWHSPMLDDISAAKSWEKIETGMRLLFVKNVLGKLPVMQHFVFGSIVAASEEMGCDESESESESSCAEKEGDDRQKGKQTDVGSIGRRARHAHDPHAWGECCGIKIPSRLGSIGEISKVSQSQPLRVPFD